MRSETQQRENRHPQEYSSKLDVRVPKQVPHTSDAGMSKVRT